MKTVYLNRRQHIDGEGSEVQVVTEAHASWTRGWLARVSLGETLVTGPTLIREYLAPDKAELSRAGNGNKHYHISDGYYEASSVWRSGESRNFYFKVVDSEVTFLTVEQMIAELASLENRDVKVEQEAKQNCFQASVDQVKEDLNLPTLKGSEKQVAWADKIRHATVAELKEIMKSHQTDNSLKLAFELLCQHQDAKWWIDHRGKDVASSVIVQEVVSHLTKNKK